MPSRASSWMYFAALSAGLHSPASASGPLAALVQRHDGKAGPGCAVGLSQPGKPPLRAAWGLAEVEHGAPNRVDTVFEAGSAAKQMTAAAVLLLARDGKVRLDADVRTYLPELPDWGYPVTVDHLLNHTSGLRDWRYVVGLAGWPLGTRVHSNADALAVIARQRGLNHQPGHEFSYTNSGYSLAAVLVERVSGKSLAEFSREHLFEPLGMTSTQWRDDFRRVVKNRAVAYSGAGASLRQDMPFEHAFGPGGLLTTVDDLLRWNAALSADRIAPGLTSQMESVGKLSDGTPLPYGRGLFVAKHRGSLEVGHLGVTAGYRAWAARYPAEGIGVAVLCNGPADARAIGQDLADLALSAEKVRAEPAGTATVTSRGGPAASAPGPRWSPSEAELRRIVGHYRSDEADATLVVERTGGRISLRVAGRSDPPWILSPTFASRLVFPFGKVELETGMGGEPCRLLVTIERLRRLPFDRVDGRPGACSSPRVPAKQR